MVDAQERGILRKRLKYHAHSKLRIVDDLGYLDIDAAGADLLFQLICVRCEQRSTAITTNVGIGGWAKVFGDEVAANTFADQVLQAQGPADREQKEGGLSESGKSALVRMAGTHWSTWLY